jgi:hypothetical protein
MIPARYLFDITREKNEFGQPHQKCPSSVEEKLCIVSGLQLDQKKIVGQVVTWKKKKFAGVGRVSSSIFW